MIEREVKILEVDEKHMCKVLKELGAEQKFDDNLYALFYDFEDERLKEGSMSLRLRKSQSESTLTLKHLQNKDTLKVAEETELVVSDFNEMRALLSKLGLSERKSLRKHRVRYSLDGCFVDIDKYLDDLHHVPCFIEIEGPDDESIFAVAEKLSFKKEDCKPWSTGDLVRHYKKR
ncbi:CYTH domain-containing protein [Candidatus Woesearchaeota archaeon]|nr:CYTH domain-containing protein [Candidatus Woesearchaeota archaeon]